MVHPLLQSLALCLGWVWLGSPCNGVMVGSTWLGSGARMGHMKSSSVGQMEKIEPLFTRTHSTNTEVIPRRTFCGQLTPGSNIESHFVECAQADLWEMCMRHVYETQTKK